MSCQRVQCSTSHQQLHVFIYRIKIQLMKIFKCLLAHAIYNTSIRVTSKSRSSNHSKTKKAFRKHKNYIERVIQNHRNYKQSVIARTFPLIPRIPHSKIKITATTKITHPNTHISYIKKQQRDLSPAI